MKAVEVWISRTEAQLENHRDDLSQRLHFYKVTHPDQNQTRTLVSVGVVLYCCTTRHTYTLYDTLARETNVEI